MVQICWAFLAFCTVAYAGALAAQAPAPNGQSPQLVPRTPPQREHTYEAQRRINLHIVVTDSSGKPVAGLKPEDFTVLDRGQSQKIARFEQVTAAAAEDDSVHGLVVLDAINGGKEGVDRVRKELVKLLGQGRGPLNFPLEIVVVSDGGTEEGQPATDRNALIADLAHLTRNIHSTDCDLAPGARDMDSRIGAAFLGQVSSVQGRWNCLNTHLTESLNALNSLAEGQQNANGRAIVIWTGPGWPLPRQLGAGQIMPGGAIAGDLSGAIVALEAAMQEGQVTLEAVASGRFERAQGARTTGLQGSLAGASLPEQEAALELPALAEQTGGLALEKSKNLADALNTCLADGEQYYSVAFDPAPAAAQVEYRSIEVRVDRPGATARTLTGYYAEP